MAQAHEADVTTALSADERRTLVDLLGMVADQQGLTPGVYHVYRRLGSKRH